MQRNIAILRTLDRSFFKILDKFKILGQNKNKIFQYSIYTMNVQGMMLKNIATKFRRVFN